MAGFSSAIQLASMDYMAPSQACVVPLQPPPRGAPREKLGVVKLTLQDCLACSGCVTSAETMLVTSQSREVILDHLRTQQPRAIVVSVAESSAASLAGMWSVSLADAMEKVAGFFQTVLGATAVIGLAWAERLAAEASAEEWVRRIQQGEDARLPMIVSACPGWVCYCEKSHPALLPLLCPVRSPMGIAGGVLKKLYDGAYHISVQPCFDRKLEAVRDGLAGDSTTGEGKGSGDTDAVVSTHEVWEWMAATDESLPWRARPTPPPRVALSPIVRGFVRDAESAGLAGSGAVHQQLIVLAASALYGQRVRPEDIRYEILRNANHRVVTLPEGVAGGLSGRVVMAWGFQQIQNVVRSMRKRGGSPPLLIDVMACPGGCLNGGAQLRIEQASHTDTLHRVVTRYGEWIASSEASGETEDVCGSIHHLGVNLWTTFTDRSVPASTAAFSLRW